MTQVKTLNDYIQLLKPAQQDLIVAVVLQYGNRPDFHKGLLPFLPADEATQCLKYRLEDIKVMANTSIHGPERAAEAVLGERFIRQTMSVFAGALIYRLSDDEASEVVYLKTIKLKKRYGTRFDKKFCIRIQHDLGVLNTFKRPADSLVELQMVACDQWKVTCHKDWLQPVLQWLTDEFR